MLNKITYLLWLLPSVCLAAWTSVPLTTDYWEVAYSGFGSVDIGRSSGIVMKPMRPTKPNETHAALVLSKLKLPANNYAVEVEFQNQKQLRLNNPPNPWEVFWLFTSYVDGGVAGKTANYSVFKLNGAESGTIWNESGQTFVYTADQPAIKIGNRYKIRVVRYATYAQVYLNGSLRYTMSGTQFDRLYTQGGSIGLYAEDATVKIYSVSVNVW